MMRYILCFVVLAAFVLASAGTSVAKPTIYETDVKDWLDKGTVVGTARLTVLPNGQWVLHAKLDGAEPDTAFDAYFRHRNLEAEDTVTTNANGTAVWHVKLGKLDPLSALTRSAVLFTVGSDPTWDQYYMGLFDIPRS